MNSVITTSPSRSFRLREIEWESCATADEYIKPNIREGTIAIQARRIRNSSHIHVRPCFRQLCFGGHYHEASLRAQISCAPKSQSLRSRRSAKAALEFSSNRGLPLRVNQVNRPDGQKIGRELVEQRFSFAIALEHTGILAVNANGENSVGRK